jgi:lysophospholipase L1-like esterase
MEQSRQSLSWSVPVALAIIAATAFITPRLTALMRAVRAGKGIADHSRPFERQRRNATVTLLVVGDSSAVGTGADTPEQSIAGRLAAIRPWVDIVNRGCNGARMRETHRQLESTGVGSFDAVLVHAGANDVLRWTPLSRLRSETDRALAVASRMSKTVIVTNTANFGLSPVLFAPLSWLATRRLRKVRAILQDAARKHGASFVDFFRERREEVFRQSAPFLRPR